MALASGTKVDNFVIDGPIGAGSMGDVLRAFDVALERPVALKILSSKHRNNDELRARFTREARAVAKMSHPNVVQVFANGVYDERPYIAMELLDGIDLKSAVEARGPLQAETAAGAVGDAANGLAAAAAAGLIHRDVKPANLVLLGDGRVKVTDFGLAKPINPGPHPPLTAMGVVVGTPDYIAPEQARGDKIDYRVDVYALGGTLYFLLTGRPPYRTGDPKEDKYLKVVARHLQQPVPDAKAMNPSADPRLSALAMHMMAKKASDRPDYAEVADRCSSIAPRSHPTPTPAELQHTPAPSEPKRKLAPTPFMALREPEPAKNPKLVRTARGVGGQVPTASAPAPHDAEPVHSAFADTEPTENAGFLETLPSNAQKPGRPATGPITKAPGTSPWLWVALGLAALIIGGATLLAVFA